MEIWKNVTGHEQYEVSNLGRVRHTSNGLMKLQPRTNGYVYVSLCLQDWRNKRDYSVHRLVALAFLPNPENLPLVNHLDENKHNNPESNLEWCTHQHNMNHSRSKSYDFVDPDGKSVTIRNLSAFCKERGLTPRCMTLVHRGVQPKHRGWTI